MTDDKSPFAAGRESPIDRAIDRAVRKMMQIDPPAGLRRRVLSRIDAPPPRRAMFLHRYVVAAAALAALILAAVVVRDRQTPEVSIGRPQVVATQTPPVQSSPIIAPAPAPAPPIRQRIAARTSPRRAHSDPIVMPRVTNAFGAGTSRVAVAALDDNAESVWSTTSPVGAEPQVGVLLPLVIPPIGPRPLETPAIVIPPLGAGRPPIDPLNPR